MAPEHYNSIPLVKVISNENYDENRLQIAFDRRDLADFRKCISKKVNPDIIFDEVLSTHGCFEYVKECWKYYDEIWRQNCPEMPFIIPDGELFYCAIRSKDPQIIQLMLPQVNYDWYPLNYLAKNINNANAEEVIECLKLLLEHWVSPSMADDNGVTPLWHIFQKTTLDYDYRRLIIEEFLQYEEIDDAVCRHKLLEAFPDLKFPDIIRSKIQHKFSTMINDGKTEEFRKYFVQMQPLEYHKFQLLLKVIGGKTKKNHELFDFLLENSAYADVERKCFDEAIQCYNSHVMRKLVERKANASNNPIFLLVSKFESEIAKEIYFADFVECLNLLVLSVGDEININGVLDQNGNTILHRSQYYWKRTQVELLKRGASIGAKNSKKEIALSAIQPKVLEWHLDECFQIDQNGFAIKFDSFIWHNTRQMEIVEAIGNREEFKYLLAHPLISILMYYKWNQLSILFYWKFWLYILSIGFLLVYTTLSFSNIEANVDTTKYFWALSLAGIVYLIFREFLQIYAAWQKYVSSFTNFCDWSMIAISIVLCSNLIQDRSTEKVMAVLNVIIMTIGLFQLLGSLPVLSMSTRIHMFEVVCMSFLKNFLLYSVFVASFSLCFFILFGSEVDKDGGFNGFTDLWKSFVKTTVMMTGELDAASLELQSGFSYIMLFLFVFIMTIVLYNLLNGTAISDILETEKQAKLNEVFYRAKLINRYDRITLDHWPYLKYIVYYKYFWRYLKNFGNCNPMVQDDYAFGIEKNLLNIVYSYNRDFYYTCQNVDDSEYIISSSSNYKKIENAMRLLEERKNASKFDSSDQIAKRLENAEKRLGNIERRYENKERRLNNMETRCWNMEKRSGYLEKRVEDIKQRIKDSKSQLQTMKSRLNIR